MSRREVQRWKSGGLTVFAADRIAAALNTHPVELWGLAAWNAAQADHAAFLNIDDLDVDDLEVFA